MLAVTVVSSGLPALEPLGFRAIFDRISGMARQQNMSHPDVLLVPVVALAALWLTRYVLDLISALTAWRVRLHMHRDLLAEATERLHRLPLAYHQGRGVGETMTRIDRGVGTLMEGLSQLTFQAIPAVVYITVSVLIMLRLSLPLTLLAAAFVIPPTLLGRRRAGKLVDRERAGLDRWCSIYDRFQQVLTGIKVVKSFGREHDEQQQFIQSVTAAQAEALGSQTVGARLVGARTLWGNIGRVAVLGAGGYLALEGTLGVGTLVAFMGYVGGLYGPAQALLGVYETLRKAELGMDAIFDVLDAEDAVPDPPSPQPVPDLRGDIELDRVTFSYSSSPTVRPALDDLSLHIGAGELVAVVGTSGAGKSTLMDLILRFHDPTSGAVRIDGHDLRTLPQRALRQKIGVVTQEAFLFEDTIEANIRYGSPNATHEEVVAAAEAARCAGLIARLPQGYDTLIGPGGVQLAGGERQRIAIARTLLKDPAIVLLDEPTSCLDVEAEIAVQEAIERLAAGRTTLLIAHRLAATTRADRVVVMDEGRVIEEGTPAELMRQRDGRYRRMMRLWQGAVPRMIQDASGADDTPLVPAALSW
ncbi:ABC transporter, ATP-binding/permease protein [Minicystis rosea]|nr:ABC transporter, ATP-binding/permease protein [Minicystis rosea]